MLKVGSRYIWKTAVTPVVDFVALVLGAVFVYLVRYRWLAEEFLSPKNITRETYLTASIIFAAITILIFILQGVYELDPKKSFWSRLPKIVIGLWTVLLGLIVFLFFNEFNEQAFPNGIPVSRFILAFGGFSALGFLLLGRLLIWVVEKILYAYNIGKTEVVCVGQVAPKLLNWLRRRSDIKEIHSFAQLTQESFQQIEQLVKTYRVSEIYLQSEQIGLEKELAFLAEIYTVDFVFQPAEVKEFDVFGIKPVQIDEVIYLELKHGRLDGWSIVFKRLLDIVLGLLIAILTLPLMILIAIAIKLDSPGPVFYWSERVGANGKIFKALKFRRMKQEYCIYSETDPQSQKALEFEQELIKKQNGRRGPLYKIVNDPRNTRVGDFLERTSLDDLPQIFNVLKGEMSLVGPRPHQPREVRKYAKHHFKVLNAKPGLTGMAQVNGRSNLDFEEEVKLDRYYIENWTLWLDIKILLKTPFVMFYR
jgi:exopolysaccharide biosynthesis polyprenyl glycosylphosphotransferase